MGRMDDRNGNRNRNRNVPLTEEMVEAYAKAVHENYRKKRLEDAVAGGLSPQEIDRMRQEDNMADWEYLKESYKEDNRDQIRYLEKRFETESMGIGIRPVREGAGDSIKEITGSDLETLAEAEHERWMKNKRMNGWTYGKRDNERKHHPDLVPYSELDEAVKDYDRAAIRHIPEYLAQIGYELYRKSGEC